MTSPNWIQDVKNRSGWSIFMGVLSAVLGLFLIAYPLATATITTVLLGWTLIFVGIAQFVFALHSLTPGKFFLKILAAALYGITGIALAFAPIAGVEALTALLGPGGPADMKCSSPLGLLPTGNRRPRAQGHGFRRHRERIPQPVWRRHRQWTGLDEGPDFPHRAPRLF